MDNQTDKVILIIILWIIKLFNFNNPFKDNKVI